MEDHGLLNVLPLMGCKDKALPFLFSAFVTIFRVFPSIINNPIGFLNKMEYNYDL
jgi:hypothetical protein